MSSGRAAERFGRWQCVLQGALSNIGVIFYVFVTFKFLTFFSFYKLYQNQKATQNQININKF